jgi:chemotaxis response regulator CheB
MKPAPKSPQKKPVNADHRQTPASPASTSLPIVGIGASAGGLEALDKIAVCFLPINNTPGEQRK